VRIHVIGINYWPEQTGIAVFSTGRAEYLAARGHQVTVCSAVPYYPEWRVAAAYRRRPFAREQRAGVDLRRCPIYVPSTVNAPRRVLHEASFVASAFLRSLCCRRPDLLLVVSPPVGLAVAAAMLSWIWRVPYVFHVEDLQPDAAVDLGMIRGSSIVRMLYAVERLAYRRAAAVSTLNDAMRDRVIAKGIPAGKVVLFSGWADPALFDLNAETDDAPLRAQLGLSDAFVVLHAGNMGVKQGLDVVIDAASRMQAVPDLLFVLVGDGAVRPALEARVHRLGLSNVRIVPLLSHDQFLRLLATAGVCLVTQQRSVADIVFPSKVLTLLAAGKATVASVNANSQVAHAIQAAGAGEVVVPENPGALIAAIERLRADRARRATMAADGRAYARRLWDRETTLARQARTLEAIAVGHPFHDVSSAPDHR